MFVLYSNGLQNISAIIKMLKIKAENRHIFDIEIYKVK